MVALFTRAWIEIAAAAAPVNPAGVALFTRAWIEIEALTNILKCRPVALFTRAWIEMSAIAAPVTVSVCRPLHEGVD